MKQQLFLNGDLLFDICSRKETIFKMGVLVNFVWFSFYFIVKTFAILRT